MSLRYIAAMEFPRKSAPDLNPNKAIEFQIIDWYIPEADRAAQYYTQLERKKLGFYPRKKGPPAEYEILVYGVTAEGHSIACKIIGFCPYFYLKCPADWEATNSPRELRNKLLFETVQKTNRDPGTVVPYVFRDHLASIEFVKRKEYWGFTDRKDFQYIKVKVKSLQLFNILKRWFGEKEQKDAGWKLYGSNLDPFLKYIHERKIEPCGWVRIPGTSYNILSAGDDDEGGDGDDSSGDSNAGGGAPPQMIARTNYNIEVAHDAVRPKDYKKVAPFLIASFDIECTSSHGDFPVAKKDYRKLSTDLIYAAKEDWAAFVASVKTWIVAAFTKDTVVSKNVTICRVYPKSKAAAAAAVATLPDAIIAEIVRLVQNIIAGAAKKKAGSAAPNGADDVNVESESDDDSDAAGAADASDKTLIAYLTEKLPPLKGDSIIQIGTTVSRFGSDAIIYKHLVGLKSTDGVDGIEIEHYKTEAEVILAWKAFIANLDPDILTGYNIFGFDMKYIWERAEELNICEEFSMSLGRLTGRRTILDKKELSSSALGDNVMYFFDMDGVVQIDMLKVMQRDHKLDSFKLDFVAETFLKDKKDDLKPREIFEKYLGSSEDRAVIAKYCIQDCALCNRLLHVLKVIGNNVGMGNVCYVPLSYLFMRGQSIKIFSLVSRECHMKGYVIPVVNSGSDGKLNLGDEGYEGAIVLEPMCDMYLDDPITVFDYSSLYPSCMISRNLSHDAFVNDEAYANLDGVEYQTIEYDIYEGVGDKKKVVGKKTCVFAQFPNGEKGILPTILMELLRNRKLTRKKIEYETLTLTDGREVSGCVVEKGAEYDVIDADTGTVTKVKSADVAARRDTFTDSEQAVLDALQLAYKITANSLYGQTGSRFSAIYLKEIAACTTATGREMIHLAKNFMEREYGAEIVYGDTDSIFCKFPLNVPKEQRLEKAIQVGIAAEKAVKAVLPAFQSLAYEKVLYPLILLSKKRYIGNLYEKDPKKFKQKSMGVVLKRRDNAQIVKIIYGGIIEILLNKNDLDESVRFLQEQLQNMVDGKVPLENLIISKTLKSTYKDPTKIAHKVLAERMGDRDIGNKPMVNDRVPYIYIKSADGIVPKLQGDRIEHPDYIREQNLTPDYYFYITNQLLKPICQLYALCLTKLPSYNYPPEYWEQIDEELLGKEIYKNDKKRENRLQNLKMREVENLLFEKFIRELAPTKPKAAPRSKAAAKGGTGTSGASGSGSTNDPAHRLCIVSTEIKRGKEYSIEIKLFDKENAGAAPTELWSSVTTHKNTKIACLSRATEKAFAQIVDKFPEVSDLMIETKDRPFITDWKKAMKESVTSLIARRDAAGNDAGEIENINYILGTFMNLVEYFENISYKFQIIS